MHQSNRQLFLNHIAQVSPKPMDLEIVRAKGIYLYDINEKSYIDFISGISVSNVGHCHPNVVKAIQHQAETYMHLMVYGEYVQAPQIQLAKALTAVLPPQLNSVFYTNSGTTSYCSKANKVPLRPKPFCISSKINKEQCSSHFLRIACKNSLVATV